MTGMIDPVTREIIDQLQIADQLLTQVKKHGVSLVAPGELLAGLTKAVYASDSGNAHVSRDPGAVGERLGGVHPVRGLRRPPHRLQHQRDRVPQREIPVRSGHADTSQTTRPR
jgi:hypothetical protein